MQKTLYLLITTVFLFVLPGNAQVGNREELKPVLTQPAVRKKIFANQAIATQSIQDTVLRQPLPFKLEFRKFRKFNPQGAQQGALGTQTEKSGEEEDAPADDEKDDREEKEKPNVWSNFLAASLEEYPYVVPPDPSGAVSSSQVVVATNASIKVFEKRAATEPPLKTPRGTSGRLGQETFGLLLNDFFAPLMRRGSVAADPHVRFDRLSRRWFFVAIEVNRPLGNNYVMLAVSDGERLTETSTMLYYRFQVSSFFPYNPMVPFAPFLDYPTLGVDRYAAVIGGVHFFRNTTGSDSVHFVGLLAEKRRLLQGQLVLYALRLGNINYTNFTGSGMYVPQGVYNDDPAAAGSYFAGTSLNQDGLQLAAVTYNASGIPTRVSRSVVPIEPYNFPRDVTALGSPMTIDALDTRLFAAAIYKNKLTGQSSLWTAHAIGVNSAGTFVPDEVFVDEARTASRWYEVGNVYTQPRLSQYGTTFDDRPSGRRAISYFNPSIAASGQGYAVMGGTTSAFNRHLNVFVADRYHDDPAGTTNAPTKVTRTKALYALAYGNYTSRWGDFSQTVVDPDDDQTIWTFQEYANTDDSYGTRAVQLKAPPPATPLPLGLMSNRRDTVITIKGISVDHSAFFDPGTDRGGPGYKRLTVKSTGGIIVGDVRYISPTELSARLNIRNKPVGTYTLIITNPDGQVATTTYHLTSQPAPSQEANEELLKIIRTMKVFPNPTDGPVTLQFTASFGFEGKIMVLDINGKQLLQQSFSMVKGNNQLTLSLASFLNGTYIVAVYDTNNVLVATQIIVKQ